MEYLNLWRGNINQVQYSWVSKCQQSSTVVCKFNHMCVHVQKKISKFNHNQCRFEKISKNFQSPVQVNWVWKKSKKFSKFNSSKTWVKKISKFQSTNAWLWNVRKFWKYPKSKPKMAEPGKISKFQIQKPLNEKENQKINSKFRLAEIFSNFSWIFTIQH